MWLSDYLNLSEEIHT